MRILADENMPAVAALFDDIADDISLRPGRALTSADVTTADVLLVRSITRVDRQLVGERRLRFVGSATIGVDHVDQDWLASRGIPFANAPGCNAQGVVDYVLGALLALFSDAPHRLVSKRVAVVGAGNVGGRLVRQLRALGLTVLVCDPPRQAAKPAGGDEQFVDLATAFEADVVCCHTPLIYSGPWPTYHMITPDLLARMPEGAVFLNAGRGEIVESMVLGRGLKHRPDLRLVLDVWEPEPSIPLDLMALATLATGHIAGYSMEGRVRGTWMLRQSVARQLGLPESGKSVPDLLPAAPPLTVSSQMAAEPAWQVLCQCVLQVCDPLGDDRRFRDVLGRVPEAQRGDAFDAYRKDYATRPDQRRELASTVLNCPPDLPPETAALLRAVGFQLAPVASARPH